MIITLFHFKYNKICITNFFLLRYTREIFKCCVSSFCPVIPVANGLHWNELNIPYNDRKFSVLYGIIMHDIPVGQLGKYQEHQKLFKSKIFIILFFSLSYHLRVHAHSHFFYITSSLFVNDSGV